MRSNPYASPLLVIITAVSGFGSVSAWREGLAPLLLLFQPSLFLGLALLITRQRRRQPLEAGLRWHAHLCQIKHGKRVDTRSPAPTRTSH